jgi:hypothetical protein
MRFIVLFSLVVVLLSSVSVNAQKGNVFTPKPIPIQYDHDLIIEDDATGSFLVISPMSGAYKFIRCRDGLALSGTGVVSINGCAISFEDLTPGRRVLASIDECTQQAKASVSTFALIGVATTSDALLKETLGDADMRDNTMTCLPKKQ